MSSCVQGEVEWKRACESSRIDTIAPEWAGDVSSGVPGVSSWLAKDMLENEDPGAVVRQKSGAAPWVQLRNDLQSSSSDENSVSGQRVRLERRE